MGKEYDQKIKVKGEKIPWWKQIENSTFPGVQGTPYLNHIAAKAVFFKETLADEYRTRQFKIVENAKRLAADLMALGYDVLTGGTDNHMVLINVANSRDGLTGATAQKCLEECGIIVDRIPLPYDKRPSTITSGIRLGTPIVTKRGMGVEEIGSISALIDVVLKEVKIVSDSECGIDESFKEKIKEQVKDLCSEFPIR